MSKKLATISLAVGLASAAIAVPIASADATLPQDTGGCNMVWHLSPAGSENMMAGAAQGGGQTNMIALVLARFSSDYCGVF